jgi:hypothetical protein
LRTRRILEAMAQLEQSGVPFHYAALEGRLADPDKSLLASIAFADQIEQKGDALRQALACLESLESKEQEERLAQLRARVKAAEREGRIEEALAWAEELSRAEKAPSRSRNARLL